MIIGRPAKRKPLDEIVRGEMAALDCGIAMANFAIAARVQGAPGEWELPS